MLFYVVAVHEYRVTKTNNATVNWIYSSKGHSMSMTDYAGVKEALRRTRADCRRIFKFLIFGFFHLLRECFAAIRSLFLLLNH